MEKIRRDEIDDLTAYERKRPAFRRHIIELKKRRRLAVGDKVSLVFDNRETVLFQIQEMLRTERIVEEDEISYEIETYNLLLPETDELAATLFIEVWDKEELRRTLNALTGLDEMVFIRVGKIEPLQASFEPGRTREDKISSIHYIRWLFPEDHKRAFLDPAVPASLIIDHGAYRHESPLEGALREDLIADLQASRPSPLT